MTTRYKITEQIERLYVRSFDREDLMPVVDRREISLLVDQVANTMIAAEQQAQSKAGIVDIPTCVIATYADQAVNERVIDVDNSIFSVPLPAYPIQLPMDIGVWSVSPSPLGQAYIPIKTDWYDLLSAEDEGLLEDQVGFYVEGKTIIFTKEPTPEVKIKLLVVAPELLDEFDMYPIPADMEIKLIQTVVEMLTSRGLPPEKPKG